MTVAKTSSQVYYKEIEGSKETGQHNIVLSAFVAMGEPATAKMIQRYLKGIGHDLEINVVSRSVNNLHSGKLKDPQIVWFGELHCKVTGRKANHYEAILKIGKQATLTF